MIDKTLRMNLLFDFYGQLLTEKQRSLFELYFHDDLSLGEIAEQYGVSRQAVYDILKRSQRSLEDFEGKLGLVAKYVHQRRLILAVQENLLTLEQAVERINGQAAGWDRELSRKLQELRGQIEEILAD